MIASQRQLEGHFACDPGFLVMVDCLGRDYKSSTSHHSLTITLPSVDPQRRDGPLTAPQWSFTAEDSSAGQGWDWGAVVAIRREDNGALTPIYAEVDRCRVVATVAADDDEGFNKAAKALGDEIAEWWVLLTDWMGVLGAQNLTALGRGQQSILTLAFQYWGTNEAGKPVNLTNYQSMFAGGHPVEVLEHEVLSACMDLSGLGKHPPPEWLFIRDARALLQAGYYRRAIIDAGTAAELAMTALIDKKLQAKSRKDKDALFKKYQALSGLTKPESVDQ